MSVEEISSTNNRSTAAASSSISLTPPSLISHKVIIDECDRGLYLIGGWKDESFNQENFVRDVWKLNFSSNLWTKLRSRDAPPSLANHTVARLDARRILVYGGSLLGRGDSLGNNNETYLYDTKNQLWSKLATTGDICPKPSRHWFGQAMCKVGSKLYVATGRRDRAFGDGQLLIHSLDLNSLRWSYLSTPDFEPEGRVRHELVVYDGKLYIFGGAQCSFEKTFTMKTIPCFDPISATWIDRATKPDPKAGHPESRTCHTIVRYGENLYVCGGYFIPDSRSDQKAKSFDDFWKFHLPTFQWTKMASTLPFNLWAHAADITSDGRLYILGGCRTTTTGKKRRSETVLTLNIGIPRLENLAWRSAFGNFAPRSLLDGDLTKKSAILNNQEYGLTNYFIEKLNW
uniref:Uncharacterized protein n=1 Tax=Romanomermis culicivorax TaxID=13658 RepID=A0A915HY99_ROMCU